MYKFAFLIILLICFQNLSSRSVESDMYLNQVSQLNYLPLYPLSDTWLTRSYGVRQGNFSSIAVKYKGLHVNSVLDGSLNMIPFWNISNDMIFLNNGLDARSCSDDFFGHINIESSNSDSSNFNLILGGGNIFGGSILGYKSRSGYLSWQINGEYLTSSGFDISDGSQLFQGIGSDNSDLSKLCLNGSFGIDDKNSFIFLDFLFSDVSQGFPISESEDFKYFMRNPDNKTNLINLRFSTLINNIFILSGNIFYYRNRYIIEKFDNENMNSYSLQDSYKKTFEESRYGWNTELLYSGSALPPVKFSLNYAREGIIYQANQGLNIENYMLEKIKMGIIIQEDNELLKYIFGFAYKLSNPLSFVPDKVLSSVSNFEYIAKLSFSVANFTQIYASHSRKAMLPQMYSYYQSLSESTFLNAEIESAISTNYEAGLIFGKLGVLSDLLIDGQITYFISDVNNLSLPFSFVKYSLESAPSNFTTDGLELSLVISHDNYAANFNAIFNFSEILHFDNFGREIIYPRFLLNVGISAKYDFGLLIRVNSNIFNNLNSNLKDAEMKKNFTLFNVDIEQKVFNNNSFFVRAHNITNEYYEIYSGFPMPGASFAAGIRLSF